MIRITGGKFKRKKLASIDNFVRPTSSFKREAFFSIIESYATKNSYELYQKKTFLDLFAGIGTMGLEAISRGIEKVVFFENNYEVIKVLNKNCMKLCNKKQYKIFNEDLEQLNIHIEFKNISIIYIDPPYNKYNISNLLSFLQNKINKDTIIGIESSIKDYFEIPNKLKLIKKKKYGRTNLSFLVLS